MTIIFGLGNIGEEYKNTRHNAGKIVSDIAEKKLDGNKDSKNSKKYYLQCFTFSK